MVLNLLLNAVQAIEGPGTVRVKIGSQDQCASVRVTDSGRGIPEQQLSQIFRPFYTTRGMAPASDSRSSAASSKNIMGEST